MTTEQFIEKIRVTAIKAYASVYGIEKWNSLTDEARTAYLHIVAQSLAKSVE